MNNPVIIALAATAGTWLVTALGASTVIFFKKADEKIMNFMLGFASGVMIAAGFWSLLEPAVEKAEKISSLPSYWVITIGFLSGSAFMFISDKAVSLTGRKISRIKNNSGISRIIMLVVSITVHNIPEGLAVGVAFGALQGKEITAANLMGAVSVAIGIGLQNFPEGAAVSLPLRREGFSRKKSFFIGQASGFVEPIAGVLGAALVVYIQYILPYALAFAAGAMILVAVHELIPECQKSREEQPYLSTSGIISGFSVMTLLDVMLG